MTKDILEAVKGGNLGRFLDVSGRRGFKLLTSAIPMFPDKIMQDLKDLKKTSSTFDGIRGQKVMIDLSNIF